MSKGDKCARGNVRLHQCVSVRGGFRNIFHRDNASSTSTIVHHKLLPQLLGKIRSKRPGNDIAAASGSVRDEETYRLTWITLRRDLGDA